VARSWASRTAAFQSSAKRSDEPKVPLEQGRGPLVGQPHRRLPELGEALGRDEGRDLVGDEGLDGVRQRHGEDLGPVRQGVLEDRFGVDDLGDLVRQVEAEGGLHRRVVDEVAGALAEDVGAQEAAAGPDAGDGRQQQDAREQDTDDREDTSRPAELALVEGLDLALQLVAFGSQRLDVVGHGLVARAR
jgi:hypothetical protein